MGLGTILAMLHDYAHGEETSGVIRKELKVEPAEFDKQFLAYVEAQTKTRCNTSPNGKTA
jgi:hypothetical protein